MIGRLLLLIGLILSAAAAPAHAGWLRSLCERYFVREPVQTYASYTTESLLNLVGGLEVKRRWGTLPIEDYAHYAKIRSELRERLARGAEPAELAEKIEQALAPYE